MKGVDMGHSEDYIRNKTYELEKQKVEIERDKLKVLTDIRDTMFMMQAMFALEIDTRAKKGEYSKDDIERVGESMSNIKDAIEKRWSE
jgi:hypothetical protein